MSLELRLANQTRDPSAFTSLELVELNALEADENGFVLIGEIANDWLGESSQYIGRYFHGSIEGYPKLVEGLAYYGGENGNYHAWKLAQKDVKTFIIRLREHCWANFNLCR